MTDLLYLSARNLTIIIVWFTVIYTYLLTSKILKICRVFIAF